MVLPEVTTGAISDKSIANGRASVEGTIVDAGEPAYTERGFAYGVNHNPTVEDAGQGCHKTLNMGSGTTYSTRHSTICKVRAVRSMTTSNK